MTTTAKSPAVTKLETGISSLDIIAKGGLPKNRTTLISGTAGSGKTVFAVQFIAAGIERGEPGVFVTFEESADNIRENMHSFGWDLAKWEAEGKLAFVDASPDPEIDTVESGGFDLGALRMLEDVNNLQLISPVELLLADTVQVVDCDPRARTGAGDVERQNVFRQDSLHPLMVR